MSAALHFCTYESRPTDFVAVKLLALSLERHAPDARLHVFTAEISEEVARWLADRPNVLCHKEPKPEGNGWDIKSELLLWMLDQGHEQVVWIDTDIILAGGLPRQLTEATPDSFVMSEEPKLVRPRGVRNRARDLGLEPRTDVPDFEVNSSVVHVGPCHRDLLEQWRRVVLSPAYNAGKEIEHFRRPLAFQSDQSVLSAFLGSTRFEHISVTLLRESREIAQCLRKTGYRPGPRAFNVLRGTPPFVHAMFVPKPWHPFDETYVWEALSPYRLVAMAYYDELLPGEREWMLREPPKARLLRKLFRGNPELCGLPLALRERWFRPREVVLTEPQVTSGDLMREHGVPLQ